MPEERLGRALFWLFLLALAFLAGGLIATRGKISWPREPRFLANGLESGGAPADSASESTTETDVTSMPAVHIIVKH